MNKRNRIPLVAVAFCFLLIGSSVLAQGSAAINWWVFGGGGAPSNGGAVAMDDTLGQPIIGPSSSGNVSLGAGYWYGAGSPAAMELASLAAVVRGSVIVLSWETVTELDLQGFNVYRSQSPDGEWTQLNDTLIPGQSPDGSIGAQYDFVDIEVVPGVFYYYWLEAVDIGDLATQHGPVRAMVPISTLYRCYLPIVSK